MFLIKYAKYKKKYLNLKNNLFIQKGGNSLPNIFFNYDLDDFIDYCFRYQKQIYEPRKQRHEQQLHKKQEQLYNEKQLYEEEKQLYEEQSQLYEEEKQLYEEEKQLYEEETQINEEETQINEEQSQLNEEQSQLNEEQSQLNVEYIRLNEEEQRLNEEYIRLNEEEQRLNEEYIRLNEEEQLLYDEEQRLNKEDAYIIPNYVASLSFYMFKELLNKFNNTQSKFNIIVGASNLHDPDYERFGNIVNSSLYSLYIDKKPVNSLKYIDNNNFIDYSTRQYNMYTIYYEDIIHNNNYLQLRKGFVDNIHFDFGVSEWCPINYLDIATHILKPGGKIIWDIYDAKGFAYNFEDITQIKTILKKYNAIITNIHVTLQTIPIEVEVGPSFTRNRDLTLNYDIFFNSNKINPQIPIIFYGKNIKYKKKNYFNNFINFCNKKYSNFTFEKKYYTYENYTYPVPLRIVNSEIEHIFNNLFDNNTKQIFLDTKKINIKDIQTKLDNIALQRKINKIDITSPFTKRRYYIQATRK